MPIHRTSDGKWQWGSHGAKYSSRKGAERQAAAAHANGYTGKAKGGVVEKEKKKTSKTSTKKSNSKKPKGK